MWDNFTIWAYSVTKLKMRTCPAGCGTVGKYVTVYEYVGDNNNYIVGDNNIYK